MKEFKTLMVFFFIINISQAQELPEIIPPSPTVFELNKYGNVNVNENTGKISTSIPLHTYDAGNLKIPVYLSYIGAGVKIDQLSSWTGINWNLKAGGVISRIVKDRPDELAQQPGQRRLYGPQTINNMDLSDNSQDTFLLNDIEVTKSYDTQADQFNFSFLGYSGSFFLDENFNVKLSNYEQELRIEFSGGIQNTNDQVIVITTPDGIKFFFGGTNCEKSRLNSSFAEPTEWYTTAYYLYKVVHPFGDVVNFEYGTEAVYNIKLSEHEKYTELPLGGSQAGFCNSTPPTGYVNYSLYNKIYNGKYLTKITSNRTNKEIHFNSTLSDFSARSNYIRILNNITFFTGTNQKQINFKYIKSSSRFFLEEVHFSGLNDIGSYKYSLEYNNPLILPPRFSYAKDYLGYYNGKNSNATLLPKNNSAYFQNVSGISELADRKPDFNYAVYGTLNKIIYPTGGYTQFNYGAPLVKEEKFSRVSLDVYSNLSEMNPNAYPVPDTQLSDLEAIGLLPLEGESSTAVTKTKEVTIEIDAIAEGNINHHYKIIASIEDHMTNEIILKSYYLSPDVYNYNWSFRTVLVKDHTYTIKLDLIPDASHSIPYPVKVNLGFSYPNGFNLKNGLGVRIEKITDYSSSNSEVNSKTYYYNKIEDVFDQSNIKFSGDLSSAYIHRSNLVVCCGFDSEDGVPGFPVFDSYSLIHITSETLSSLFSAANLPSYEYVSISYGGDNFENGGVEKKFGNSPLIGRQTLRFEGELATSFSEKSNFHIYNSKLRSIKYLKNEGEQLYVLKQKKFDYHIDRSDYVDNLIIERLFNVCGTDQNVNNSLEGVYIGSYRTYSNKLLFIGKTITNFIDPIPVNIIGIDTSTFKKIQEKYYYDYGLYTGLPTEIKTISSKTDKIFVQRNFYVNERAALSGLTISQLNAFQLLEQQNRLNVPIQVNNYIEENGISYFINKERKLFYNNFNLILPEKIQNSKGNNSFKNEIIFSDYDYKGNLTEVSLFNGSKTRYFYNARGQVIAKIENYKSSNIEPQLGSLCYYQEAYPESIVTTIEYDPVSHKIIATRDSNCKTTTYHYDSFNRLEFIKDEDGNLLQEYKYHYKELLN